MNACEASFVRNKKTISSPLWKNKDPFNLFYGRIQNSKNRFLIDKDSATCSHKISPPSGIEGLKQTNPKSTPQAKLLPRNRVSAVVVS